MSVELLSPAGNLEKLKFAVYYGADAVYFSYREYGLRTGAPNFTLDEIKEAINFLHERNKRGYITINVYARNDDFKELGNIIYKLDEIGVDAFIVSDPGIIKFINTLGIKKPIHLSTQANTTNLYAVKFWEDLGIKRIILARELDLKEIENICKNTTIEIEVFVHGAMCISYSGRCYLSNYMTKRDANRGECSHPCRWKYFLMEETREGEFFKVEEDQYGTYILNSKDLCLLEYIKQLKDVGVKSFKIEGRMKSIFYTSLVTAVYRQVLDALLLNDNYEKYYELLGRFKEILSIVSNRGYTKAFIDGVNNNTINVNSSKYIREGDFIGFLENKDDDVLLNCRSKVTKMENLSIYMPDLQEIKNVKCDNYIDYKSKESCDVTKPSGIYIIKLPFKVKDYSLLIRKHNDK
jgi:putative protease